MCFQAGVELAPPYLVGGLLHVHLKALLLSLCPRLLLSHAHKAHLQQVVAKKTTQRVVRGPSDVNLFVSTTAAKGGIGFICLFPEAPKRLPRPTPPPSPNIIVKRNPPKMMPHLYIRLSANFIQIRKMVFF